LTSPHELKGRDLLCLTDYSAEQITFLLDLAAQLKARYYAGERVCPEGQVNSHDI